MINLNKEGKIPFYVPDAKEIVALLTAVGILLAGAVMTNEISGRNVTETDSSAVTTDEADSSITCIIEDVGTVQNVDTKPDNLVIADSNGKSSFVYGGSSQEISLRYYVYLKDSNNIVYQFSVTDDVYMAMSRKKGDTISIFSKETLFGNVYYWQGNKLENPLQITESSEQNIIETNTSEKEKLR